MPLRNVEETMELGGGNHNLAIIIVIGIARIVKEIKINDEIKVFAGKQDINIGSMYLPIRY